METYIEYIYMKLLSLFNQIQLIIATISEIISPRKIYRKITYNNFI